MVKRLAAWMSEIRELTGEYEFGGVADTVDAAHRGLVDVTAGNPTLTRRQFEALARHGQSIVAELRQSTESSGLLISVFGEARPCAAAE